MRTARNRLSALAPRKQQTLSAKSFPRMVFSAVAAAQGSRDRLRGRGRPANTQNFSAYHSSLLPPVTPLTCFRNRNPSSVHATANPPTKPLAPDRKTILSCDEAAILPVNAVRARPGLRLCGGLAALLPQFAQEGLGGQVMAAVKKVQQRIAAMLVGGCGGRRRLILYPLGPHFQLGHG